MGLRGNTYGERATVGKMLNLWAAFILLAFVGGISSLVFLFIKRYRRPAKWVLSGSVVWFVMSFVGFGITSDSMNREARRLGYSGWQTRQAAERRAAEDQARAAQPERKAAAVDAKQRSDEQKSPATKHAENLERPATMTAKPAYCNGTGTYLLPECGWTEERQKAAEAAAARSAPAPDYIDEARRQQAFNCAVLREAVDEANKATVNAERYGMHETISQAMQIERAETTLQDCRR